MTVTPEQLNEQIAEMQRRIVVHGGPHPDAYMEGTAFREYAESLANSLVRNAVTVEDAEKKALGDASWAYIDAFHAYDVDWDNPQKAQAHMLAESRLIELLGAKAVLPKVAK